MYLAINGLAGIVGIISIMILRLLLKGFRLGETRTVQDGEPLHLRYGRGYWLIAIIALSISVSMAFLPLVVPLKSKEYLSVAINLILVPGLLLLWETRFELIATRHGLACHSPYKQDRFLSWPMIAKIAYEPKRMWFCVQAKDGWIFHIPVLVNGIPEFLDQCEKHLPMDTIQDTRKRYEQTWINIASRQML